MLASVIFLRAYHLMVVDDLSRACRTFLLVRTVRKFGKVFFVIQKSFCFELHNSFEFINFTRNIGHWHFSNFIDKCSEFFYKYFFGFSIKFIFDKNTIPISMQDQISEIS